MINYSYDAAGVKRKVESLTSREQLNIPMGTLSPLAASQVSHKEVTNYSSNVVYDEYGIMTRLLLPDGYIQHDKGNSSRGYVYYSQVKDHLGSVRADVSMFGVVKGYTSYYASGMEMVRNDLGLNSPYRYNGKEFQEMHGLNQYDYIARSFDPGVPRFTTVDPMAEKYYSISSYAYCKNNPINRIDPDGRDDYRIDRDGNIHFVKQTKADNHTVYATNSKGGVDKKNSVQVEKAFINSKQTEVLQGKYSSSADGNNATATFTVDTYTSFDTEKATQFFEFTSNNTDGEWSQTNISSENVDGSLITTSHSDNAEVGQSKILGDITSKNQVASIVGGVQTTILEANHSHPNGSTVVSYGDYKLAVRLQGAFPNATMHSYSPISRQYTSFGRHSIPGMLNEFIVKPQKP